VPSGGILGDGAGGGPESRDRFSGKNGRSQNPVGSPLRHGAALLAFIHPVLLRRGAVHLNARLQRFFLCSWTDLE
jgi:hypothetical protein